MPGIKTRFEGRKTIKNPEKYLNSNVVFAVFMLLKSDFQDFQNFYKFSKVISQNNVGIFIKMAQMEIK